MFHRAPGQHALNEQIDNLQNGYLRIKGKKANPERLKLIKLIQSLRDDKEYNHEATLGVCTYGLIKLGSSYELFYGEKKKSRYRFFGSELGTLLQECMGISYTNPLGEQRALIYLTKLYHHIKAHPRCPDGSDGRLVDAEGLLKELGQIIKSLISSLSNKRPTYTALVNNFSDIPEKYRKLGGTDLDRDRYAQFIKLLNRDFNDKYQSELSEDKEWTDTYTIRYGAMLFMMEKIEDSYKDLYLSPEGGWLGYRKGSQLYKACKPAININSNTKEIPNDVKRKYYIDFLSYLLRITLQPKEIDKWEKEYDFPNAREFFETLQSNLAERSVELMKGRNPRAISLSYLDIVSSAAASYGVSIALSRVVSKMSLSRGALTAFRMLTPEAALLITLLAFSLNAVVSQKATAAVNKIIINTVSQPVVLTFNNLQKLGEFCVSIFKTERSPKKMELVDNRDFISALISLPDDIFTAELKEKMRYVVAYDKVYMDLHREEVMTDKKTVTLP